MQPIHPVLSHLRHIDRPQAWLARRAGMSRAHLSDILRGKTKASAEVSKRIAKALDEQVAAADIVFWQPADAPAADAPASDAPSEA